MLLQLRPLFMGEISSMPIDTQLDFSKEELNGGYPFSTPVHVKGTVSVTADVVLLQADVAFSFHGQCDRCLRAFEKAYELPIEHILVDTLSNDENDDFILLEQYQLDLAELVMTDMLLELPYKSLCKEDCRGLCHTCGKDLNDGDCDCKQDNTDPRLEVLKQLLQ